MWTLGRSWERDGYLGVLMLHGASPLPLPKQGFPERLHAEAPGLGGTIPGLQPCPQPCPQDPQAVGRTRVCCFRVLSTVWGYTGAAGGRQVLAPQAPRRASVEGQGEELSGDWVDACRAGRAVSALGF